MKHESQSSSDISYLKPQSMYRMLLVLLVTLLIIMLLGFFVASA